MTYSITDWDWELIHDLRHMVKAGATVPQLVDEIRHRLPISRQIEVPINCWIIPLVYFREAFHISIIEAKDLGHWSRYVAGHMDDEQINTAVMPHILRQQAFWDV